MMFNFGFLPRVFSKLYNVEIIRTQNYTYKQISSEVYIIRNENTRQSITVGGMYIFLDELLFREYSKHVQDFIFLHEYGHLTMNKYLKTIVTFSMIFLAGSFVYFSGYLALGLILYLQNQNSLSKKLVFITLGPFIISVCEFIGVNWINEFIAEIFAVREIGIAGYLSVLGEIDAVRPVLTMTKKITNFISMPPKKLRLPLFKWMMDHKKGG